MYSARSTSWISAIAAAVTTMAGAVVGFRASSMPEFPPGWFIAAACLIAAPVVGSAMAIAVRSGLHLASCHQLALRSVVSIPTISLVIVGFLVTRPIETHAVLIDMKSGRSSSNGFSPLTWIALSGAILIPVFVSYVVGRLSRGKSSAA